MDQLGELAHLVSQRLAVLIQRRQREFSLMPQNRFPACVLD